MYNNDLTEGNIFKFNNITFTDLTKQHLVKSYVWHTNQNLTWWSPLAEQSSFHFSVIKNACATL